MIEYQKRDRYGRIVGKALLDGIDVCYAPIDADGLSDIRAACQTGTPLGNDAFKAKIERKLHYYKVGQARRGRPKTSNKGL